MRKKIVLTFSFIVLIAITVLNLIKLNVEGYNSLNLTEVSNTYEVFEELNPKKNEYVLVSSNDDYKMYFNARTVNFYIESSSGKRWYSTPEDFRDDKAKGKFRYELQSQLVVTYSKVGEIIPSNAQSAADVDEPLYYRLENGVRVVYFFNKMGFTIPVNYVLTEDGFKAIVDTKNITEETAITGYYKEKNTDTGEIRDVPRYADYYIMEISLLPYMAAGNDLDEGYVVIPDGSGAIVNFTKDKASYADYKRSIYAQDRAINQLSLQMNRQNVSLPLYGIKNNNTALLGIVTEGDEFASINARAAGKDTGYSTAYFSFAFRQEEKVRFLEQNFSSRLITLTSKTSYKGEKIEVSYHLLEDDHADYVGMAHKYREILGLERSQLEDVSLFIELYGATIVRKNFLGIPVNRTVELTTFDQVQEISDEFTTYADNLVIKYTGWNRDGLKNTKLPIDAKQNGSLGSRREYSIMVDYLEEQGVEYYANIDLINFYENGNGIFKFFHSAKGISQGPALQLEFLFSTTRRNAGKQPGYILSPHKFTDVIEKYFTKYTRRYDDSGIALDTFGQELYSNFGGDGINRIESKEYQLEAIKWLKENKDASISLYSPNAYFIPYLDNVFGIPTSSSQFNIFAHSIPFYQIVFAGSLEYAIPAINQSDSPRETFLQAIETGGNLAFGLFYQNAYELKNTEANDLNNSEYHVWKDDIKTYYEEYKQFKKLVLNQFIDEHEMIGPNVFKTSYENGYSIIVNYNEEEIVVNDVTIKGKDYQIFKDNQLVDLQGRDSNE